jgi:hypothetical protein
MGAICGTEQPASANRVTAVPRRSWKKLTPERWLCVEARFLRKPGQSEIDPATGEYRSGQFESWTRFEVFDPALRKP